LATAGRHERISAQAGMTMLRLEDDGIARRA